MVTGTRAKDDKSVGEDNPPHVLTRSKTNIGVSGGGFGYDIEPGQVYERPDLIATRIKWLSRLEGTALDLLNKVEGKVTDANRKETAGEIREWLKTLLSSGPVLANEVESKGAEKGYTSKQLRHAKDEIGAKSRKGLGKEGWYWLVPS